jgi:hypothetical protein
MRLALFTLWALAVGGGCERKAPGPAECREFAYRVLGVTHSRQLTFQGVRARVDELTRQCLVTPFDRELLRCVDLGQSLSRCSIDFNRRRIAR